MIHTFQTSHLPTFLTKLLSIQFTSSHLIFFKHLSFGDMLGIAMKTDMKLIQALIYLRYDFNITVFVSEILRVGRTGFYSCNEYKHLYLH